MSHTPGPEFTETGGHGSHKPALLALARFIPVRSVIEYGGGIYSTRTFLNREHFPDLESLVTFEHDDEWAAEIKTGDPRHVVIVPDHGFIAASAGMHADFVFIDCVGERRPLVTHGLTIAPLVAIHDCQEHELGDFGLKYVRGFNSKIQTVFASNEVDLSGMSLQ